MTGPTRPAFPGEVSDGRLQRVPRLHRRSCQFPPVLSSFNACPDGYGRDNGGDLLDAARTSLAGSAPSQG